MLFIIDLLTIWDLWSKLWIYPKVSVLTTIIIMMTSMVMGNQEALEHTRMILSRPSNDSSIVSDMDKMVKQNYELTQIMHCTFEEHQLLWESHNLLAAIHKISNEPLYILHQNARKLCKEKYAAGLALGLSLSSSRSRASSLKSTPSPKEHVKKHVNPIHHDDDVVVPTILIMIIMIGSVGQNEGWKCFKTLSYYPVT